MKTFDDFFIEVVADKSLTATAVLEEAAKRYARQCCEDVLQRAADRAKAEADPAQLGDFGRIISKSITSTPINLP